MPVGGMNVPVLVVLDRVDGRGGDCWEGLPTWENAGVLGELLKLFVHDAHAAVCFLFWAH